MSDVGLSPRRRFFPILMSVALFVLAALSITRFVSLRSELHDQVETQLEAELQDRVTAWEDRLLEQVGGWLETAASDPAAGWATELRFRTREPWLSSVYLWKPAREIRYRGRMVREPASFLYPLDPPDESNGPSGAYNRNLCLAVGAAEDVPAAEIAATLLADCRNEPRPVRMLAASKAAEVLSRAGEYEAALAALDGTLSPDTSLRAAVQKGVDPYRAFMHRLQRADVLEHLGRSEESLDLLYESGIEAADLAAPEYAAVRQWVDYGTRKRLIAQHRTSQVKELTVALARADRRYRAWEEIGQRILPQPAPAATQGIRFTYDQYNRNPFLLVYGPARNGEIGAALELDQQALLVDFLATMKRYRAYLVVTDAQGERIAGARGDSAVAVQVPFARSLTHLRVGLYEDAVAEGTAKLDDEWVIPLVVICGCVFLGAAAIWAQVRADRQQVALLARQREFTARVTHELKTPLAGIKIMAENLESGAFSTEWEREDMARSIIREADRLAARVEEILAVAKERQLPTPEPFDPEESLLEAVDQWGPRLEQVGMQFSADLDATDQVLGDASGLRDAVGCLLDNALKYRDETKAESWVSLNLRQEGAEAIIDVADNGLGVPAEKREAIFERFVRVEGPNRGKSGGHGLGLSQVREIVSFHKGKVTCAESDDGGAKFTIRLPVITRQG